MIYTAALAAAVAYVLIAGVTWRFTAHIEDYNHYSHKWVRCWWPSIWWPLYWGARFLKLAVYVPLAAVFRLGAGRQ